MPGTDRFIVLSAVKEMVDVSANSRSELMGKSLFMNNTSLTIKYEWNDHGPFRFWVFSFIPAIIGSVVTTDARGKRDKAIKRYCFRDRGDVQTHGCEYRDGALLRKDRPDAQA